MYEPKYKLNKKDEARWNALLIRHCLDCPVKPGRQHQLKRKCHPPLTPAENAEFERLCRKRSRKIEAHPKVAAAIRRSRYEIRKTELLLAKLKRLLKLKVDRKG